VLKSLRRIIFENFFIKFFSVLFAVLLWFHVVSRGKSEVNFVVPLELKDIPKGMVVVGDIPGHADVRLQGQEGIVKGLTPKDIGAFISLSGAKEGDNAFSLSQANVKVPGNIDVVMISPTEVRLHIERLIRKSIQVKPEIAGKPAPGYTLLRVEISPPSVWVQGPEGFIRRTHSISTEPIDIDGMAQSFDRAVELEPPGEKGVMLEEDSVKVSITLRKARE
jgi:YbbR domain-containing protein